MLVGIGCSGAPVGTPSETGTADTATDTATDTDTDTAIDTATDTGTDTDTDTDTGTGADPTSWADIATDCTPDLRTEDIPDCTSTGWSRLYPAWEASWPVSSLFNPEKNRFQRIDDAIWLLSRDNSSNADLSVLGASGLSKVWTGTSFDVMAFDGGTGGVRGISTHGDQVVEWDSTSLGWIVTLAYPAKSAAFWRWNLDTFSVDAVDGTMLAGLENLAEVSLSADGTTETAVAVGNELLGESVRIAGAHDGALFLYDQSGAAVLNRAGELVRIPTRVDPTSVEAPSGDVAWIAKYPLILRWDAFAAEWTEVGYDLPGFGTLRASPDGEACIAATKTGVSVSCWDGTSFKKIPQPTGRDPVLIHVGSKDDVWVRTRMYSDLSVNLLEHWNGSSWTTLFDGFKVTRVGMIAEDDFWFSVSDESRRIYHYNGTWVNGRVIPSGDFVAAFSVDDAGGVWVANGSTDLYMAELSGVSAVDMGAPDTIEWLDVEAVSASEVYVTGYDTDSADAVLARWDGSSWEFETLDGSLEPIVATDIHGGNMGAMTGSKKSSGEVWLWSSSDGVCWSGQYAGEESGLVNAFDMAATESSLWAYFGEAAYQHDGTGWCAHRGLQIDDDHAESIQGFVDAIDDRAIVSDGMRQNYWDGTQWWWWNEHSFNVFLDSSYGVTQTDFIEREIRYISLEGLLP